MTSFAFGNFAGLWCCSQQRADVASVTDWHMGRMKKAFVDSSSKQLVEKMMSQKLQWFCLMDLNSCQEAQPLL